MDSQRIIQRLFSFSHRLPARRRAIWIAAYLALSIVTLLLLVASAAFFSALPMGSALVRGPVQEQTPLVATQTVLPGAPLDLAGARAAAERSREQAYLNRRTQATASLPLVPTQVPTVADGRLLIPALDVDETLATMPLQDGTWDVSSLQDGVGWLEGTGAFPGGNQAMVLMAHVTLPGSGDPGPFYHLQELRVGKQVEYQVAGMRYIYRVSHHRYITPGEVHFLFQPEGNRLVLITCTGWNPLEWTYDQRLLVEADLVRTAPVSGEAN